MTEGNIADVLFRYLADKVSRERKENYSYPLTTSDDGNYSLMIEFRPDMGKFLIGMKTKEVAVNFDSFNLPKELTQNILPHVLRVVRKDFVQDLIPCIMDAIRKVSETAKQRFNIICITEQKEDSKQDDEEFNVPMYLTVSIGAIGEAIREFRSDDSKKDRTELLATGRTKKSFICLFFDFNSICNYKFSIRITRQDIKRDTILSESKVPFIITDKEDMIDSIVYAIKGTCQEEITGFPIMVSCPEPKDIRDYLVRTAKDNMLKNNNGKVFERDVIGRMGSTADISVPKLLLEKFLEKTETLKERNLEEHADTVSFFGSGGEADDNCVLMLSASNQSEKICITVMHGNHAMPMLISPMDGETFSVEELAVFLEFNSKLKTMLETFSRTFWDNRKISIRVEEPKPMKIELNEDED